MNSGLGQSAGLPLILFWLLLPCSPLVGIIMLTIVLAARLKRVISLDTIAVGTTLALSTLCLIAPLWLILLYPMFAAYFGR